MSLLLLLSGPSVQVIEPGTIDGASTPNGPAEVVLASSLPAEQVVNVGTIDGASTPKGPLQIYAEDSGNYRPW